MHRRPGGPGAPGRRRSRTAAEHATHTARTEAEMDAAALAELHHARAATERVRQAAIAARAAGVSVRRTADIGEMSVDSVTRWTKR
ncbi:hypothetical protein AB0G06_22770 [Nonomuraea dietziae]|uniref:hypothetical protein n=1 Tax=Nonomuraea dietziae TaxID=65515 RepID=UPI0033C0F7DA